MLRVNGKNIAQVVVNKVEGGIDGAKEDNGNLEITKCFNELHIYDGQEIYLKAKVGEEQNKCIYAEVRNGYDYLMEVIHKADGEYYVDANNLTADNIKSGVNILGVTGTFEGGSGGNTLKNLLDATKSAYYLFYGYTGTTTKNLIQYSDTENVRNFNSTYKECTKLTEVMATDTRNGTDFSQKYRSCIYVEKFPQIDTSNGTDFTYLYENDWSATYVPPLITNKATRISQMYASCSRIPKIDITHYKISSTSNCNQWCYNCKSLKAVIIRSFGASYVLNSNSFQNCYWLLGQTDATYNPNGEQGYVYIPRDMIATLQAETNWSVLQFRALEDYTLDGTCWGEFDDEKAGL